MKINRIWLLLFTVVILVIVLLFWRRPMQQTVEPRPIASVSVRTNHTTNSVLVSNITAITQNNLTDSVAINAKPGSKFDLLKQPEMLLQYDKTHNVPIEFYGLVIDQNSNPVPDVKINATVLQLHANPTAPLWTEEKETPMKAGTDEDGHFVIQGMKGSSLHIDSVQKDSYRLSSKTKSLYVYYATSIEAFHPDQQNPIIIRMWKLGKSANLISHRTLFEFQPDGRAYTLDLLADKKIDGGNANGDLQIQFQRQPSLTPHEKYPWTLEIATVGGGLVETTDEFDYIAPENGYQPQISFQTNSISPKAMPDIVKDYYFTSRNGQVYGVVSLQIFSDYNGQSAILVNSRINPNGSRNLQP